MVIRILLMSMWLAALAAVAPAAALAAPAHTQSGALTIAYEVHGEGEPIVLIPGFSQSREAWHQAGFVDAFVSRGYRVIAVDPRGHGDSSKPHDPDAYRPEALAGDVIAVLDDLGIGRAHLMGYSRGGWIALVTAARYSARVRSVVAGGAHPYAEKLTPFRAPVAAGLDEWVRVIESRAGRLSPPARQMFLSNDIDALRAAVTKDRADISAEVASSPVPILLYAGARDPRAPLARKFAQDSPAADYHQLPEMNHFQAFFATDAVVEAVDRRLRAPASD